MDLLIYGAAKLFSIHEVINKVNSVASKVKFLLGQLFIITQWPTHHDFATVTTCATRE